MKRSYHEITALVSVSKANDYVDEIVDYLGRKSEAKLVKGRVEGSYLIRLWCTKKEWKYVRDYLLDGFNMWYIIG